MNLTVAEIGDLPLVAAAFDRDGEAIAATPEWEGPAPGAVTYAIRGNRLVVCTGNTDPACAALTERLVGVVEDAARPLSGAQRLRVAMLAASLRLVAGRAVTTGGTSHDVLDHAVAGIAARSALRVDVEGSPAFAVHAPEVAALVLVQLAVNAERHSRVSAVTLSAHDGMFHVTWAGTGASAAPTARRREARERWGLGFARIAADTLGGAVYPPDAHGAGSTRATLELGIQRLALPLAAVAAGRVLKATRAWDEETGQHPGRDVGSGTRLAGCVDAARAHPGRIAVDSGWWSRAADGVVWVAIPPDDILDRARDVLDGMVHERALWDGIPEPAQSRMVALASLLGALLGVPLPRVPAGVWNRKLPALCAAFGSRIGIPDFDGIGAVDPRIVAFLAAEVGENLVIDGDAVYLRVRSDRLADPVVRAFVPRGSTAWKLS